MQHLRGVAHWLGPVALASCLCAPGWAGEPAAEDLERAEGLYSAGDLLEAEPLYQALARSVRPELRRQASDRLLTLYARLGRADRAVQTGLIYQTWLTQLGDRCRLQSLSLELGQNYLTLGHYAEAEAALKQSLSDSQVACSLSLFQQLSARVDLARIAENRHDLADADARWRMVERLARGALTDPRLPFAPIERDYCVRQLADAYRALGRFDQAAATLRPLRERLEVARDVAGLREVLRRQASIASAAGNHTAAEADLRRALKLPDALNEGPFVRADLLAELAELLARRSQRDEADAIREQAAAAYRVVLDNARARQPRSARAAEAFWKLERLYERGRLYRRALQLTEEQAGLWTRDTPLDGRIRAEQGSLQVLFSAFEQAREPLVDALAKLEQQSPPDLRQLPPTLNALAVAEQYAGLPARAQELGEKCLALYRLHGMPDDLALVEAYNILGTAAALNGEYAQAVDRYREGVARSKKLGAVAAPWQCYLLLNLAVLYKSQGDPAEALKACLDARELYRGFAVPDALGFACFDAALASLYAGDGRYDESDVCAAAVLRVCARYEITGGPLLVTAKHCQALRRMFGREPAAAQQLWREVLALQEKERDRLLLPRTLNYLGLTTEARGEAREAETLYRRAAELQRAASRPLPGSHFISLWRLAEIAYRADRRDEALRLMSEAVEVVEAARLRLYGDAKQRAAFFAQFVMAFERLVDWNVQAGRLEDACRAAARGRSRALLDQLQMAGLDPRDSLHGEIGAQLRHREAELRQRIAAIQARARLVHLGDAEGPRARKLLAELEQAHQAYADTWREVLNRSPLYRDLATDAGGDTLAGLRSRVLRRDNLLLWYWIGRERSYLFLVGEAARPIEVFPLTVPVGAVRALARAPRGEGTKASENSRGLEVRPQNVGRPPQSERLTEGALDQDRARALVDLYLAFLQSPDAEGRRGLELRTRAAGLAAPLSDMAAVGAALLPPAACRRIQALAPDYVLVIPDGPLHKLPLESLVMRDDKAPRYALDELPPMLYAPSATVLATLAKRPPLAAGPPSLLTIGDVAYPQSTGTNPSAPSHSASALALGGTLPLLPFSGEESRRIRRLFDPDRVTALEGTNATEKAVTGAIAGRSFIHLAAHGWVDDRHGNLFGALALVPPPSGTEEPGNDGFLELHEIYQLPLKDCRLAVLSACVTNVGPQQPLEAGVTLAGGFLAAGARHVVASHWSVDDSSTAELMGTFFQELTKVRDGRGPVPFARALQLARQQIRSRPEWASPFYWAPFVLLGPGD
jgi:CHAT domain-containing protein